MISNCGHDENGKYSGGKAGDQTGGEYCIRTWYNRPWDCVLRHPKAAVRKDIARLAQQAAENERIGYDQKQRDTFWKQLALAKNYLPINITKKCEADCSSSTVAIIKAVGYRKDIDALKKLSPDLWTGNMRVALIKAGFKCLKGKKYLKTPNYLRPGDILLNEDYHVAINLDLGSKVEDVQG